MCDGLWHLDHWTKQTRQDRNHKTLPGAMMKPSY